MTDLTPDWDEAKEEVRALLKLMEELGFTAPEMMPMRIEQAAEHLNSIGEALKLDGGITGSGQDDLAAYRTLEKVLEKAVAKFIEERGAVHIQLDARRDLAYTRFYFLNGHGGEQVRGCKPGEFMVDLIDMLMKDTPEGDDFMGVGTSLPVDEEPDDSE